MPDIEITVADRKFFVSCRAGEEHFLNAAARLLDAEAASLQAQMGRLPEARMLLMAGLMLADRTASVEDELRQLKARMAEAEGHAADGTSRAVEVHEVAVIPAEVTEALTALAARAENLAAAIEDRVA
jgi:cell division protein ZapA